MKVTKREGDIEAGIYKPDETEVELLMQLSDKIIDIMKEAGLDFNQEIFLLESITRGIAQASDVIAFETREDGSP